MKETMEGLGLLAKQMGVESDERATNEDLGTMQVRRERLVRWTVDTVVKALNRLESVAPTYALC